MTSREMLRIALSKGRILDESLQMLEKAGLDCHDVTEDSRKLIFTNEEKKLSFILGKPADIPTYVEYGAADLGIVGKDVILESPGEFYELLDMHIGYCKMVVAREKDKEIIDYSKVASKYPRITGRYFEHAGRQVDIIELNGSVELAPLIGLADLIVDLVSTGKTLQENNLVEEEKILDITSRLIANKGSYQLKQDRIGPLIENLLSIIKDRKTAKK